MPTIRKPRELTSDDLVMSHFTLGRHHDITNRLDAAAAGGCAAIGIYIRDYQRLETEGIAPTLLAEMLDERNLCLAEIEALRGWADASGTLSDDYLDQENAAFRIADAFECRYVQAIGPSSDDLDVAARGFAALCDRAGGHGLVVGLEFLPFTNIATADDALAIVEAADRPNGGVCVDIWHHVRGANDLHMIRALPGHRITGIQLSDGPLESTGDDYYHETLRTRVPPGMGEMDVADFVAAVRGTGTTVPIGLEVCNESVWNADGTAWVTSCVEGLRRFL